MSLSGLMRVTLLPVVRYPHTTERCYMDVLAQGPHVTLVGVTCGSTHMNRFIILLYRRACCKSVSKQPPNPQPQPQPPPNIPKNDRNVTAEPDNESQPQPGAPWLPAWFHPIGGPNSADMSGCSCCRALATCKQPTPLVGPISNVVPSRRVTDGRGQLLQGVRRCFAGSQ